MVGDRVLIKDIPSEVPAHARALACAPSKFEQRQEQGHEQDLFMENEDALS